MKRIVSILIIVLLLGVTPLLAREETSTPSTPVSAITPVSNPITINTVISGNTSKIFHKAEIGACRYTANLNETNAEYFDTYEDAIAAGLRPCLTCKPQPAVDIPEDPEDPEDPNGIVIIPETFEPQQLFGINGVVIEADYCQRQIDPNDLSTRIIEPKIIMKKLGEVTSPSLCPTCFEFNSSSGVGNVPPEFLVPFYNHTPADVYVPDISVYNISSNMWVFVSDQSHNVHINGTCEGLKSVPVYVVNMRNGLVAGSTAFWNPVKGKTRHANVLTKFSGLSINFLQKKSRPTISRLSL